MLEWVHRRTMRRRVFVVGAGAALFLLTFVLGRGWYRSHLAAAELEKLRSRGVPTNHIELNDLVAIAPGAPDATAVWMKPIRGSWAPIRAHAWDWPICAYEGDLPPPPGTEWRALPVEAGYVRNQSSFYQLINDALRTEGKCCYVCDYRLDGNPIPHIRGLRSIHQMLALRAFVRAHQGNISAAADDLLGMLEAAETLRPEPSLHAQILSSRSSLFIASQPLCNFSFFSARPR